jgi:hypothetical protein
MGQLGEALGDLFEQNAGEPVKHYVAPDFSEAHGHRRPFDLACKRCFEEMERTPHPPATESYVVHWGNCAYYNLPLYKAPPWPPTHWPPTLTTFGPVGGCRWPTRRLR